MRLCECGCGAEIPTHRFPSQQARYVHGHNGRRALSERFAEKVSTAVDVSPNGMSGCIVWTGAVDVNGYGRTGIGGVSKLAHRSAWFLEHGEWPEGDLDHLCRRPGCVNVDHLEPVTHAENMRRGAGTKLTSKQATEVRNLRLAGWRAVDIAEAYGISRRHVYIITNREAWVA